MRRGRARETTAHLMSVSDEALGRYDRERGAALDMPPNPSATSPRPAKGRKPLSPKSRISSIVWPVPRSVWSVPQSEADTFARERARDLFAEREQPARTVALELSRAVGEVLKLRRAYVMERQTIDLLITEVDGATPRGRRPCPRASVGVHTQGPGTCLPADGHARATVATLAWTATA